MTERQVGGKLTGFINQAEEQKRQANSWSGNMQYMRRSQTSKMGERECQGLGKNSEA